MAYINWWNRTGPVTLGERFGLNEISTARKTLSPTKSYAKDPYPWDKPELPWWEEQHEPGPWDAKDGGRIALGDGSITEVTKGPNTGKYHLRLGKDKTVHYGTKAQLEKIHKQWKITNPLGSNQFERVLLNPKKLKKIKEDFQTMSNKAIREKHNISTSTINDIKNKFNLEFGVKETKPLSPEVTKRLLKLQTVLKNTDIPIGEIKSDSKLIETLAKKMNMSKGEFLSSVSQLKQEYSNPTGRIEIIESIKKNIKRFPDPKFIREKMKVEGYSKKTVGVLNSVEKAAKTVANTKTNLEHSLPENLRKFFKLPRKYLLMGERTSNFLNQFKKQFDNQLLLAAKKHAAGNMSYADYMKEVNRIRDTVRKATGGYEIGYVDFKDGKPVPITSQKSILKGTDVVGKKTTGLINFFKNSQYHDNLYNNWVKDKKNPIYSTLNEEIVRSKNKFVPNPELTDTYKKIKNFKSHEDFFKFYKANPGNPFFRALATAARLPGTPGMKLIGGTAAFTLLSSALSAEELEPSDKKQEASVLPAVIKDHPILSSAAATAAAFPKKALKTASWALNKLTPLIAPGPSHVFKAMSGEPYKPTSGHDTSIMAFWDKVVRDMGKTSKVTDASIPLKKRLKDLAWRGLLPTRFLPLISGGASVLMGPMLIKDAAEFLQSRIDKKGLTGKIEEQSFIGDEAGAGYLMEEAYDKKRKEDAEGMDYAQGGIASLIK